MSCGFFFKCHAREFALVRREGGLGMIGSGVGGTM
jgi:hypothetical protein